MSRFQLGSEMSIKVHIALESSFASNDPLSQAAHLRAAVLSGAMRGSLVQRGLLPRQLRLAGTQRRALSSFRPISRQYRELPISAQPESARQEESPDDQATAEAGPKQASPRATEPQAEIRRHRSQRGLCLAN